jgi:hypothetical protein
MAQEGVLGYKHPGDVDVRAFKLVSAAGQVVDLKSIVVDFSIYSGIDEPYLQCDLVLNDSVGLMNTINVNKDGDIQGGFSGGDVLIVSYKSNDDSLEYKNHIFALYEMTDRKRIEERSEAYFLSGISIEAYSSSTTKICRAYGGTGGNDISKMVKSIVDEFIYSKSIKDIHRSYRAATGFRVEKETVFDETLGKHQFIIPNLSVDDTIQFMINEADSPDHIPYYFFYENSKGFCFKNLANLINQEPKETFSYMPSNANEGSNATKDENFDRTKIVSFDVIKQSDFMENATGGLFKSRTIHLDILKKTKRERVYNYDDYFPKFSKLQRLKIAGSSAGEPVVRMYTSRSDHDNDPIFAGEAPHPKRYCDVVSQKQSYFLHIFNTQLEVVIPGDSEIDVGDVIYLSIPPAAITDDQYGTEDKYMSGKYLITKLRNKLLDGSEAMSTIIECVKDTSIKH